MWKRIKRPKNCEHKSQDEKTRPNKSVYNNDDPYLQTPEIITIKMKRLVKMNHFINMIIPDLQNSERNDDNNQDEKTRLNKSVYNNDNLWSVKFK